MAVEEEFANAEDRPNPLVPRFFAVFYGCSVGVAFVWQPDFLTQPPPQID